MAKHKGLLVTPDCIIDVEYEGIEDIQRLIGCDCFTSASFIFGNSPACYVDDEGLINESPPNRAIYRDGQLIRVIFGNMLFCGINPDGTERDISKAEEERVRGMFGGGLSGPGSGMSVVRNLLKGYHGEDPKERLKRHGKL